MSNQTEEIEEPRNTEIEFAGIKLSGSKILLLLPVLSALGGALWGGFEFYKDYMDMKDKITSYEAPDISGVEKRAELAEQKAVDSVDYTRDIKSSLQDDIVNTEDRVDRLDQKIARSEELLSRQQDKLKNMIDNADERFENQRARLQSDNKRELRELEERLNRKIQQALDNPLSR